MTHQVLIADSGSTKTEWVLLRGTDITVRTTTQGINPFMLHVAEIESILRAELLPHLKEAAPIDDVYFYGAGCRGAMTSVVSEALHHVLGVQGRVEVKSDLLGAARAVCGHTDGLACILGTGSNSCLFVNGVILENVSPLGFILGDEGSGAVLGRRLVGDVLKRQLPEKVIEDFHVQYAMTADDIIRRVYKETFPNRFLASFAPFLSAHREEPAIQALLVDEFSRFFHRNVDHYQKKDLKVNLVGSIAYHFSAEVEEAARLCGYTVGHTLKAPMDGLVEFHKDCL